MTVIKNVFLLLGLCFFSSCINQDVRVPERVLSKTEMVPIMVDMHLVEGARSGKLILGDTNQLPDYYAKVYAKHNVSEDDFKASFHWYGEHPEKLQEVFEEVIVELSKIEGNLSVEENELRNTDTIK